ncbi:uncharacterized protein LY79DRAFT_650713 [Colletotrichum navitas]|uniref:Protein kinase domain-containing protein n=1 Tax=Colletotrichum navitas TaxID=681940 RepID=A0AAD8PVV1_9PEZI|nr:uncharacterized protein LY79DRAFT_650713 [Colletotrichum navitas]KAK1585620.1 hypothetical protein LY79DRAFT_650713 [Colletotrichum navitas]
MEQREIVEYRFYCPPGVQCVLACGSSAFIGEVDDSTVLNLTLIIGHKGLTETGLCLERAVDGTIFDYLTTSDIPTPSLQQRLAWCRELCEAVEHVRSKRVIHCDIQPTNVLVDRKAHFELADFQGRYLSEDGNIILDGWSGEPCRYFCPRDDEFVANFRTGFFALGSTIHFIMTGQEGFSDIFSGEAGWDDEVKPRFARDSCGERCRPPHAIFSLRLISWIIITL